MIVLFFIKSVYLLRNLLSRPEIDTFFIISKPLINKGNDHSDPHAVSYQLLMSITRRNFVVYNINCNE